jgi:hypothetical protein
MTNHALPQFLQDLIESPPRAGEGVHAWLFRVSRQLHAHLPAGEIVRLLESRVMNCGRSVPRNEIVQAVQNSLPCAWQAKGHPATATAPRWPETNSELVKTITGAGLGQPELWEASPIRFEDSEAHTEAIIDRLYPSNPLLCCGVSKSEFNTRPREDWRGSLADMQLIVPSPMTSRTGITQAGKESAHALSNTGPRRFVVCEFDGGSLDEQASLLLHLATKGPMVLALHSGGKSMHGWFSCAGHDEQSITRFFRYAVSLGADSRLWTRSQFCRMPDGRRDNGNRQTVFFFNPKVMGVSK